MKKIHKMQAGEFYLIESTASANSVYFETDALAKLFFRYCDYYLKDYLHVEEYVLNKDGWAMLIKVRSASTIRKHYRILETGRKSNDGNSEQKASSFVWRILSERVRLFISTYVRMSNKVLGREGTLVRRKYGRYQFESLDAAKDYVAKIRKDQHEMQQSKVKYRGYKEHFRMNGNILTNPLRSSLWVELRTVKERIRVELKEVFGVDMPVLEGLSNLVALKFKLTTREEKLPPPKPPNS